MAFPVEVRPVESRAVEFAVTAVGAVEAFEAVEVTARVAGAVEKVRFREGDKVKLDEVMVEIEPQRYQLAARQAAATTQRAKAQREDAERGLKRREALGEQGLASVQEVETYRMRVDTTRADVGQAQASQALASLNLRDAFVRAPVTGIVEERRVVTGEYVQPGSVLAIIVQREPLLLRFKVAEDEAVALAKDMQAHFTVTSHTGALEARIVHVAARAGDTARMVSVLAEIQSPPKDLRPGAFAQVRVGIGEPQPTLVVPQTAVRPTERGFLCYVVEEGVAKERVVELGLRTEDGMVAVKKGLTAGEKLVVRGAEALRDGASVTVSEATVSG
jgi:multidrug efflux system membrane fusion protein